jgi:hypothetical protein
MRRVEARRWFLPGFSGVLNAPQHAKTVAFWGEKVVLVHDRTGLGFRKKNPKPVFFGRKDSGHVLLFCKIAGGIQNTGVL